MAHTNKHTENKMKISKDSWHFKLNSKFDKGFENEKVYTTCSYIRLTIVSLLCSFLIAGGCVALLIFLGIVLVGMLSTPMIFYTGMPIEGFWNITVGFGVGGWIFTGAILASKAVTLVCNKTSKALRERAKEKQRSLASQALKDRKDGICTIVAFN